MSIRMALFALAPLFSMSCALGDPPPAPELGAEQQDLEAPACGPICVATPENSFLAAAYGPDCATAYSNALTNALPVANGNCVYEGYPRACNVHGTPQFCQWVPSAGAYEGYTQVTQGCRDTTC